MQVIDIVLPEPKTNYEVHQRWMNFMTAQWIGESSFSKIIEVEEE